MGLKNTFNFPVPVSFLLVSTEDLLLANLQLALIAIPVSCRLSCDSNARKMEPLNWTLWIVTCNHSTEFFLLANTKNIYSVHLGGKYPGLFPRCSWMTGKRGQSPRYLRPFRSSNNGKFPANALLCPGRGVRGFTLTCALLKINPVSTVEGKITSIIFFSDRERVVFYKSCDLIGSESGQYSPFPARSQRVRFFSQPFVRF